MDQIQPFSTITIYFFLLGGLGGPAEIEVNLARSTIFLPFQRVCLMYSLILILFIGFFLQ